MKKLFLLIITILSLNSLAFVPTRTIHNQKLRWDSRATSLDIYLNPLMHGQSTMLINPNDVVSITEEVINSWNNYSTLKLDLRVTEQPLALNSNRTIQFSNNPKIFGSGVLAVTSITHSAATGRIHSADILINDTFSSPSYFTDSKTMSSGFYAYLGDVLSHEIGHLWGLGHSEVFGSTMVYSIFKGQYSIHTDDIAGLHHLYRNGTNSGAISGKIVTGNQVAVFGAQVQAISYDTGKVVSGVYSEEDGSFLIENLPNNDAYLIYIVPPRGISSLPIYYSSVQTRYCSGKSYVPSFFTKCNSSEKGKPQVISLKEKSKYDVGNVTIKCDESLDPKYLVSKNNNEFFELNNSRDISSGRNLGATLVGYFSKFEIENSSNQVSDKFKLNYSEMVLPSAGQYYLTVKIITEEIGSAIGTSVKVNNLAGQTIYSAGLATGNYLEPKTNHIINVPLSSNSYDNEFELEVSPIRLNNNDINAIFANQSMTNQNSTYLILVSISQLTNSGLTSLQYKNSMPYSDNTACIQGESSFSARANTQISTAALTVKSQNDAPAALSCGTVDIDDQDGPGGGLFSLLLGFMVLFSLLSLMRKRHVFFV
jgi:hypothetical protein